MSLLELISSRSEGRWIAPLLVLMHVCETHPLAVAVVEFVIFEAHSFTKYLGSIYCVCTILLGSGNRAVNKTPCPFLSELLVKLIVQLGN